MRQSGVWSYRVWSFRRVGPFAVAAVGAAFLLSPPRAPAEESSMLMAEIAGNRYEQRSFDRRGRLTSRAAIEVGELREAESGVEVPLTITTYDAEGKVKKRLSSTWACRAGQDRMVMPLLFLSSETASSSRLLVEGDPILYPEDPVSGRLPDISLRLEPEKGAFAFFGGRSEIGLTERSVSAPSHDEKGAYAVTAMVEVRVYALGIRVRKRRFESQESVAAGRGLVRQVLQAADGSSFVVRLIDEATPTSLSSGSYARRSGHERLAV